MKVLLHKKLTKKGFTLAELLIVVAILAILVAVSIPIFTSQLDKARKSTDEANLRACKSLVVQAILTDDYPDSQWKKWGSGLPYNAFYDADKGCLVPSTTTVKGYGQGSGVKGETNYTGDVSLTQWKDLAEIVSVKDAYIAVTVSPSEGIYALYWIPTT